MPRKQEYRWPTPMGELRIVQARQKDVLLFRAVLTEAGAWLQARGIQQWMHTPPAAYLAAKIRRGDLYLAWREDELVGVLALQWADPEMWGARPPDAGYIHHLAVRRACAGQGWGRALLRWAEAHTAATGRRYVRLDCWAGNPALVQYYKDAGYTCLGVHTEYREDCLFEKAVVPAVPGGTIIDNT